MAKRPKKRVRTRAVSQPSAAREPDNLKPLFLRVPSKTLKELKKATRASKSGPMVVDILNRLSIRPDLFEQLWNERDESPIRDLTIAIHQLFWGLYAESKGYLALALQAYSEFLGRHDQDPHDDYLGLLQWTRYRASYVALDWAIQCENDSWYSKSTEDGLIELQTADRAVCYAIALLEKYATLLQGRPASQTPTAVISLNLSCAWAMRARIRASIYLANYLAESPFLDGENTAIGSFVASLRENPASNQKSKKIFVELWNPEVPHTVVNKWRDHGTPADDMVVDDFANTALMYLGQIGTTRDVEQTVLQIPDPSDVDPGHFLTKARDDEDLIFLKHDNEFCREFRQKLNSLERKVGKPRNVF